MSNEYQRSLFTAAAVLLPLPLPPLPLPLPLLLLLLLLLDCPLSDVAKVGIPILYLCKNAVKFADQFATGAAQTEIENAHEGQVDGAAAILQAVRGKNNGAAGISHGREFTL